MLKRLGSYALKHRLAGIAGESRQPIQDPSHARRFGAPVRVIRIANSREALGPGDFRFASSPTRQLGMISLRIDVAPLAALRANKNCRGPSLWPRRMVVLKGRLMGLHFFEYGLSDDRLYSHRINTLSWRPSCVSNVGGGFHYFSFIFSHSIGFRDTSLREQSSTTDFGCRTALGLKTTKENHVGRIWGLLFHVLSCAMWAFVRC